MSVSEAHFKSGAQAVQDITSAMLKAAGECLKLHGPDPTSRAILGAATAMFVDKINSDIDPSFKRNVMTLLGSHD